MEEEWRLIAEFPNYIVSNYGEVVNEYSRKEIRQSKTAAGAYKVGLMKDNIQHTRSVKVLVAEAFVEGRTDIFNTPIHLDNNQANNRADNLAWRPRWFAWKYTRQFDEYSIDLYKLDVGYINLDTGQEYGSIFEIGVTHGVLMENVWRCCSKKGVNDYVFPQWYRFARISDVLN